MSINNISANSLVTSLTNTTQGAQSTSSSSTSFLSVMNKLSSTSNPKQKANILTNAIEQTKADVSMNGSVKTASLIAGYSATLAGMYAAQAKNASAQAAAEVAGKAAAAASAIASAAAAAKAASYSVSPYTTNLPKTVIAPDIAAAAESAAKGAAVASAIVSAAKAAAAKAAAYPPAAPVVVAATPAVTTPTVTTPSVTVVATPVVAASAVIVTQGATKPDKSLDLVNYVQIGNTCGNASLGMVMNFYGINGSDFMNSFSNNSFGHGPVEIARKANSFGLSCKMKNDGTLEELATLVDRGIPPMVLGIWNWDAAKGELIAGKNSTIADMISKGHWMVFSGYKRDSSGAISEVWVNNPQTNKTQTMTISEFHKYWDYNPLPGGQKFYMAMTRTDSGDPRIAFLRNFLPKSSISSSFRDTLSSADKIYGALYGYGNYGTYLG